MKQWLLKKWYIRGLVLVPIILVAGKLYMGSKKHDSELEWNRLGSISIVMGRLEEFHYENGRLPHNYDEIRDRVLAIQTRDTPQPHHTYTWQIRIDDCPELPAANGWRVIDITFHDLKLNIHETLHDMPINLAPPEVRWDGHMYMLPNGKFRLYESDRNVADTFAGIIDAFHGDFERWPVDNSKDRGILNTDPGATSINKVSSMDNFSFEVEGDGTTGWIIVRSAKTGYTYKYPTDGPESPRRPQEIPPK